MEPVPSDANLLRFGIFELDRKNAELRKAGVKQPLAGQAFEFLQALLEHPGEAVTREALRDRLWPNHIVVDYDLALRKAVNRVREVLGDSAESPRFIETIPRRGYRFLAPVQTVETTSARGTAPQAPWKLAVSLALVVAAGLLFALNAGRLRTRIFAKSRFPEIRSIAVLPLENLSKDPDQEYFSDGMTDALTTELAQIGSLRVISRTSSMHFKGTRETLPQIGQELKVDAVVEGSAVRAGERIRITAQLIETQSDQHLWAKSYERNVQDVLALQDEVARDIAEEIRIKLTPHERTRLADARPVDPEAHDAYLRGRYFWNRRTEAELHKAKDYFEQAIAKDPGYAPAYSGLADTYFYLSYGWGHIPPREGMPLARAAALKAIELDESSAEGHTSLGNVKFLYDWDFPAADQEAKRAIVLNPNYELGHHLDSVVLAGMGRSDESVAEGRKAVEVDPLSVPANNILGAMLQSARRFDEALAVDKKTLDLDPNPTHLAMVHTRMSACYRAKGLDKEAFEEDMTARLARGASPQEIVGLSKIHALSGRNGILKKDLQEALARWDKAHWHNDAFAIAMLYVELGDMNNAFAWIDKCIELRSTALIWIYIGDGPLQHDPRFAEVKRKMGVKN
jgi:TolB-like protein/DNA-binding winged helix-turn-helix (wHTH) protein/Tfp pilus assembly protein PilF